MKKKKKKKAGGFFILLGFVLLFAAAGLFARNMYESDRVNREDAEILCELTKSIEENKKEKNQEEGALPDYVKHPDKEMPVVEIGGRYYIGYISFPSLGIDLPVQKDYTDSAANVSPCRYKGSLYTDDLVIAGHNYYSQLYQLKNIRGGEKVIFTDAQGNAFYYIVTCMEILAPEDVEYMVTPNDWELTVFTCTYGAGSRRTIRCTKTDS